MKKSKNQLTFKAMDSFISTFREFWSHAASAQAHYQLLFSLDQRLRNAPDDERGELEEYRKSVKTQFEEESSKLFSLMDELSNQDGDICMECYDMMHANKTICVNFARVLSKNSELSVFFSGFPNYQLNVEIYKEEDDFLYEV